MVKATNISSSVDFSRNFVVPSALNREVGAIVSPFSCRLSYHPSRSFHKRIPGGVYATHWIPRTEVSPVHRDEDLDTDGDPKYRAPYTIRAFSVAGVGYACSEDE